MLRKLPVAIIGLIIIASCQQDIPEALVETPSQLSERIDDFILDQIVSEKKIFYWDEQEDAFICEALPLTDHIFVIGVEWDAAGKRNVESYLEGNDGVDLVAFNDKLGIFHLRTNDCSHVSDMRQLSGVQYIELEYFPSDISRLIEPMPLPEEIEPDQSVQRGGNPGTFVPGTMPYLTYMEAVDGGTVDRAYLHNMDRVFHELEHFGTTETGIAVIDNGVKEDMVGYFSAGPGGYQAEGYWKKNYWAPNATDDGPYPLDSDWFGLWQLIGPAHGHGTGMSDNVYGMAPFAHRRTLRASPTYILAAPNQMLSIRDAITAMADDDQIKIISMSMAGPFGMNQVKTSIRYFNSKNKIMVCAAGSSLPILKDILGVLFPARIPETVSVTGIENIEASNGNWQLGFYAHGGRQNDFIIEDSGSSSTATSTFAGMLTVLWGINPDMDREDVIGILVEHSTYNILQGSKHNKFGWGKVDMYEAALDIGE